MNGEKKGTLRITVILYILMFLYAVFTTMPGTQLLVLAREFGLALSEGGIFTVAVNGGCILGSWSRSVSWTGMTRNIWSWYPICCWSDAGGNLGIQDLWSVPDLFDPGGSGNEVL